MVGVCYEGNDEEGKRDGKPNLPEKSLDRISSPEQLNDYLKVTRPAVWAVLVAVILLLVGTLVWSSFAYIGSFVDGVAEVENGVMTVRFEDKTFAGRVKEGMNVKVGDHTDAIHTVGRDSSGSDFAQADTDLENGIYDATVMYRETQVLDLLFDSGKDSE